MNPDLTGIGQMSETASETDFETTEIEVMALYIFLLELLLPSV
jgi:hypothetical protein